MNRPLDETELRVYARLVEGATQVQVINGLKVDKSKVDRTVKLLLRRGFIVGESKGRGRTFQKGPNGVLLDAEFSRLQLSPTLTDNAPGVASSHAESAPVDPVNPPERVPNVHHLCFRAKVLSEGDLETLIEPNGGRRSFLKKGKPIRGQDQYQGELELKDGSATGITYHRPFNAHGTAWLYLYPPDFYMTDADIDAGKWLIVGRALCQESADLMSSLGKWRLGPLAYLEKCKPHFGVHRPELKGYSDRMTMGSRSGAVVLSDSDGKTELEVHGAENTHLVRYLVEGPEAIYEAECRLTDAEGAIVRIAETVKRATRLEEDLSTILTRVQAKVAEQEVANTEAAAKGKVAGAATASSDPLPEPDKWSVMYG